MDQWRSFFGRAGEDLWTIIEQAIILAATDYPQEFKAKRCDIAETLFSRMPLRSVTGENDATRLSGSVITNGTIHMDTPVDTDEVRDDEHGDHHEVHPSRQTNSEAHPLHDDDLGEEAMVTQEVNNVKEMLITSEQSETVVLEALQRLESLQISVEVLKATEIGKHVNNLRKHSSKRVRLLAKGLVRHWKELVDEWANGNQDVAPGALALAGACATLGSEIDRNRPFSTPQEEGVAHLYWQEEDAAPTFCQLRSLPGESSQYNAKARHEDCLEVPEVMGSSSRVEHGGSGMANLASNYVYGSSHMARDDLRDGDHGGRLVASLGGSSGSGKPLHDVYKGKGGASMGPAGFGKLVNEAAKGVKANENEKNCDQSTKNLKIYSGKQQRPVGPDEMHLADKLEAAKRKLHQGYTQAEHAKKQRVAQFIDLPNLPEGGPARSKGVVPSQGSRWNTTRR